MEKIVITVGDPAGCGPYISLKAIEQLKNCKIDFFVIANRIILETIPLFSRVKNRFTLIDTAVAGIEKLIPGQASRLSGKAALVYLNAGLEFMAREKIKKLVTAPLSKEAVKLNYPGFTGHTEYLADYFKIKRVEMIMCAPRIKTVLFTRHVPLAQADKLITAKKFYQTIQLTYNVLQKNFAIKKPRLAAASFNPHAGINTFLGRAEQQMVNAIKQIPGVCSGPYPSDTLFTKNVLKNYDCIICAYHDQGMIPFKLLAFESGVNVTAGLPIIRTSPDHGTAYDLIRNNKTPFHSSMAEAIKLAIRMKV